MRIATGALRPRNDIFTYTLHTPYITLLCKHPLHQEQQAEAERIGRLIAEMTACETRLEKALPTYEPEEIRDAQAALRQVVDRLEKLVDDELWPLPKYREMLFIY